MSHKKYRSETNCLNCGTEVTRKFCPECGQENIEIHESFFYLVGHFISDYFHFDSKFFRSLIPLFTRPGFLTKEYWQGRRVRYIHPLRMFFFITIIFMISATVFYKQFGERIKSKLATETVRDDDGQLSKLDKRQLEELKVENARRMKKFRAGIDDFFGFLKYMTFFLLPVYALVFKVLNKKRRAFYVDHLIYTIHLQSFLYFLLGVLLLLPLIIPSILSILFPTILVSIFIYVGISFQFLYQQPWWKTIIKSFLATFSLFFITIFAMLLYTFIDAMFFKDAIQ